MVLPTPAVPVISAIGFAIGFAVGSAAGPVAGSAAKPGSRPCSQCSSAVRPAKPATSGGSWAGLGTGTGAGAVCPGWAAAGRAGADASGPVPGAAADVTEPGSPSPVVMTDGAVTGPSRAGSIASSCR